MLTPSFLISAAAHLFYGRFLGRRLGIDGSCPTPSHPGYDGVGGVPEVEEFVRKVHK